MWKAPFFAVIGIFALLLAAAFFFPPSLPLSEESDSTHTLKFPNGEFALEEQDCLSGERYDPQTRVCFIEFVCESEAECTEIELAYLIHIETLEKAYFENSVILDGRETNISGLGEEFFVAVYPTKNGKLGTAEFPETVAEFEKLQNETSQHHKLWQRVMELFPKVTEKQVGEFVLFTDGVGGTLAAVERSEKDTSRWTLFVDIQDAYNEVGLDEKITASIIHEFGHILTLSDDQVEFDKQFYIQSGEEDADFRVLYEEKQRSCAPYYTSFEGCVRPGSYLNAFVLQFWSDLLQEFEQTFFIDDEEKYIKAAEAFYEKYRDRFVSHYASTNPGEDIAESWTAFVLAGTPKSASSVAEQKILFFYTYPELVRLRTIIRARI